MLKCLLFCFVFHFLWRNVVALTCDLFGFVVWESREDWRRNLWCGLQGKRPCYKWDYCFEEDPLGAGRWGSAKHGHSWNFTVEGNAAWQHCKVRSTGNYIPSFNQYRLSNLFAATPILRAMFLQSAQCMSFFNLVWVSERPFFFLGKVMCWETMLQ